jgi:outer membrane protein assembly factor BamB
MPCTHTTRRRSRRASALAAVVTAVVALAATGGQAWAAGGQPPSEWAANAGAWPAHNYDLANTRATTQTPINSQTVSQLKVKWTFAFKGASAFGAFASTPISLNGTVYLQDLNSNVFALDRTTGQVKWQHKFDKPSAGPNGVAFGDGRIYGATSTDAFALDAQTGKTLWSHKLTRNANEGVDMTPQVFDGTVLLSTVPGNVSKFYAGNGDGIVWALDAATGQTKWKFNTISDGAKLFGNAKVNSGGGLWYPPSVDSQGRVFISVAIRRRCTGRRSSRTAPAAPAPTSTPTRSSRSTARAAGGCGSSRRFLTTYATTT